MGVHDIWNILSAPLDEKERSVMKITNLTHVFFYDAFPD